MRRFLLRLALMVVGYVVAIGAGILYVYSFVVPNSYWIKALAVILAVGGLLLAFNDILYPWFVAWRKRKKAVAPPD